MSPEPSPSGLAVLHLELELKRYIGCSYVIGARDLELAEQIRVDPVSRMPLAGPRFPIERRDPHPPPPNDMALLPQQIPQHAGTRKRILQVQLVDAPHQRQRCL